MNFHSLTFYSERELALLLFSKKNIPEATSIQTACFYFWMFLPFLFLMAQKKQFSILAVSIVYNVFSKIYFRYTIIFIIAMVTVTTCFLIFIFPHCFLLHLLFQNNHHRRHQNPIYCYVVSSYYHRIISFLHSLQWYIS